MTLTLAAVYAPIGFMSGITGSLFREFAFSLAAAVIISGFVALTLSPMMCTKLLHHDTSRKGLAHKVDALFSRLMLRYRGMLTKAFSKSKIWIVIALGVYLSCFFLYKTIAIRIIAARR